MGGQSTPHCMGPIKVYSLTSACPAESSFTGKRPLTIGWETSTVFSTWRSGRNALNWPDDDRPEPILMLAHNQVGPLRSPET